MPQTPNLGSTTPTSIAITPNSLAGVSVGGPYGVYYEAVVKNASGNVLPDQRVTWTIDSTAIAILQPDARLGTWAYPVAAGTTTIRARIGAVEGTVSITVTAPAATVVLNQSVLSLFEGQTATLTATSTTAGAATLLSPWHDWQSSDSSAGVTLSGTRVTSNTVTGVSQGTSQVGVWVDGVNATCTVQTVRGMFLWADGVAVNSSPSAPGNPVTPVSFSRASTATYYGAMPVMPIDYDPTDSIAGMGGTFTGPAGRLYNQSLDPVVFEYSAGDAIAPLGGTFTRASVASYLGSDGYLRFAASGELRDSHYVNGVRTTLLERAGTNSVFKSDDITNAVWTKASSSGTGRTMGPDGVYNSASYFLEDTTVNGAHVATSNSITITAGQIISASLWLQAKGRTRGALYCTVGSFGTNRFGVNYDVGAGTIVSTLISGTGTLTSSRITAYNDGWYRIELVGQLNGTDTSVNMTVRLGDTVGGLNYTGDGTKGAALYGAQIELGTAAVCSSYIPNASASAAATRAVDALYFAWSELPQELTLFVDYTDVGSGQLPYGSGFAPRVAQLGNNGGTGDSVQVAYNATPAAFHLDSAGTFAASSPAGVTAYNDRVQFRAVLRADGQILGGDTKNGAAEVLGTATTTAKPLTAAWRSAQLHLGCDTTAGGDAGHTAVSTVRVLRGQRTMVECVTPSTVSTPILRLNTAGSNVPRDAHYIGSTRTLLLEGARTNAWSKSQELDDVAWTKSSTTVTANATTAPDGTATADKLIETSAVTVTHFLSRASPTFTVSTLQTVAFYAKAAERTFLNIQTGAADQSWISLTTGAVTTAHANHTYRFTALANGWWRVELTFAPGAVTTATIAIRLAPSNGQNTYTGDGVSGAFLWGCDFAVDASFASTYIPTTTAAATRLTETLYFPYTPLPSETTLYASFIDVGTGFITAGVYDVGGHGLGASLGAYRNANSWSSFWNNGVSGQKESGQVVTQVFGDTTEIRTVLTPVAATQIGVSKNGAAETLAAASTSAFLPATFGQTRFYVGKYQDGPQGFAAYTTVRLFRGQRSLAECRAPSTIADGAYTNVLSATSGVARDAHYEPSGGRTLLLEIGRTNLSLWSEDFTQATWGKSLITVSGNVTVAPDGVSTADKFWDTVGSGGHYVAQTVAITSGASVALSCYVKAAERFRFELSLTSGANEFKGQFRTDTSVTGSGVLGVGTVARVQAVALSNGWFRMDVVGTLPATSASFSVRMLDDTTGANSYTGDITKGAYVWGAQCENSTPFPSSYMATVGSTATRASELYTVPFNFAPQAMTVYVKFVERGIRDANACRLLAQETGAGTGPRWLLYMNGTTLYSFYHSNLANNSTAVSSSIAVANYGDVVELRGLLWPDGSTTIGKSVNGGAEVFGGTSGALPFATSWFTPVLAMGSTGTLGSLSSVLPIASAKVVVGIQSLATMRQLAA